MSVHTIPMQARGMPFKERNGVVLQGMVKVTNSLKLPATQSQELEATGVVFFRTPLTLLRLTLRLF